MAYRRTAWRCRSLYESSRWDDEVVAKDFHSEMLLPFAVKGSLFWHGPTYPKRSRVRH